MTNVSHNVCLPDHCSVPTQPSKTTRIVGEILRVTECRLRRLHHSVGRTAPALPWSGRRVLPGSGINIFLEALYHEANTSPGLIELRRSSPEKTRTQADHHSDRDRRAWKTYATTSMGVTDNIERLRAAFVQRSSRRLTARREKKGGVT